MQIDHKIIIRNIRNQNPITSRDNRRSKGKGNLIYRRSRNVPNPKNRSKPRMSAGPRAQKRASTIAIWKRHSRNGCGREGRKLLESGGVARGEYLQLRGSKNRDSSIMAPRSGLSPDRGADFCAEHVLKHESPGRKSSREDDGEMRGEGLVIFGSV